MKAKTETWTVVVAGQWNRHILTPQWVGENLFGPGDFRIETMVAPTVGGVRYSCGDVVLIPEGGRLVVGVRRAGDAALRRVEEVARKTLELLPHTPVNAYGINFGVACDEIPEALLPLFRLEDTGVLSEAGATVLRSEITRALRFASDDGETVNLKLSVDVETGALDVHVNYHNAVPAAAAARARLEGAVVKRKSRSIELLKTAYGMVLEEEDDKDDEPA